MDQTETAKSSPFALHRILLKAKYAFYSAIVFFLFANPETLLILQRFFGHWVTFLTPTGAVSVTGIVVESVLFFLTMWGLMLLPNE